MKSSLSDIKEKDVKSIWEKESPKKKTPENALGSSVQLKNFRLWHQVCPKIWRRKHSASKIDEMFVVRHKAACKK